MINKYYSDIPLVLEVYIINEKYNIVMYLPNNIKTQT